MNFYILLSLIVYIPNSRAKSFRRVSYGYGPNFTFPYTSQVKIMATTHLIHKTIVYNCTGSAITDIVVVTVGHCLNEVDEVEVGYGSFKAIELVFIRAINWTFHPDYHSHIVKNADLALVYLEDSIKFTNDIRPVHPRYILDNNRAQPNPDPQYIVMCGFGLDEKRKADELHDLKCIKSFKYDQYCAIPNVDHEDNWCFYPSEKENGTKKWMEACPGDDGSK